jgi:hypothetical protein
VKKVMDVFQITIGAVGGFLGGYLTSYLSEKAKNRAQLQDVKKLTEEKQKVEYTLFQIFSSIRPAQRRAAQYDWRCFPTCPH